MPKFASKTASKQKEQELATKLNQLVTFFHGEVLHGFIPLTVVRTVLLLILLVMGYSTTRASTLSGFCPATVRKKNSMLERGLLNKIFSRKSGSGRKSRLASTQDEIVDELERLQQCEANPGYDSGENCGQCISPQAWFQVAQMRLCAIQGRS